MEIAIGILASIIASFTKKYFSNNHWGRMAFVFGVCAIGAGAYVIYADTALFQTFMQILVVAGAWYAFVWKKVEENLNG